MKKKRVKRTSRFPTLFKEKQKKTKKLPKAKISKIPLGVKIIAILFFVNAAFTIIFGLTLIIGNLVGATWTLESVLTKFLGLTQDAVVDASFSAVTGACTGAMTTGDFEEASMVGITSGTHGIAPGELVYIKLARDVAADSNPGDVAVISIEVEWN